jgi:hypothetical protein
MWVLALLPSAFLAFIVNAILFIGVVGVVVSSLFKHIIKFAPTLIPYRTALQVVSVLILALGVYLKGSYNTEMYWREKVEEAQAQVKIAEQKAAEASAKIEYKFIDKVKVVKDVQVIIQEKIVEKEKLIDSGCKVAPEAIGILNEAAKLPVGKK